MKHYGKKKASKSKSCSVPEKNFKDLMARGKGKAEPKRKK
jgi:hypothetical protein